VLIASRRLDQRVRPYYGVDQSDRAGLFVTEVSVGPWSVGVAGEAVSSTPRHSASPTLHRPPGPAAVQ
jgi:hypothetical protein